MSKCWSKIALLVTLLVVLAVVPASAYPQLSPDDHTLFPATGDIIDVENDPYWWVRRDYAQGRRRFEGLPEMGRLIYDMQIGTNGLHDGGHCDFEFSVNDQPVHHFTVVEGDGSASFDVGFRTLRGPTYVFRLEQTNTVEQGLGSITIPLDQSGLYLFPPGPCPASAALTSRADEARLDTLYRFRNELLAADPGMRERLDAYYALAPEATAILRSHPLLLVRTAIVLRRALPSVQALLAGPADEMVVPTRDLRAAHRLLDDLSGYANPELATALGELRGLIQEFDGRTLAEGWSEILAH
jgi:hypothetical protein